MWLAPSLRLKWGRYFKLDPGEQKSTVDFAQAALGKGPGLDGAQPLITRRQALEIIAPVIGIDNIDAAAKALEDEAKKDADAATERLKQAQSLMTPASPVPNKGSDKTPPDDEPPVVPPKK